MWDCGWQPKADYGSRYDVGFIEIGSMLVEKALRHKSRDPSRGWLASWLFGRSEKLPANTEIVDQRPWAEIAKGMGGLGATGRLQFTRGTVAALWAMTRAEPGDRIVLVGFDNIRLGRTLALEQAFCPAYRAHPGSFAFTGYRTGQTKFGNHDYRVERPLLEKVAGERGVTLEWAQEVW